MLKEASLNMNKPEAYADTTDVEPMDSAFDEKTKGSSSCQASGPCFSWGNFHFSWTNH